MNRYSVLIFSGLAIISAGVYFLFEYSLSLDCNHYPKFPEACNAYNNMNFSVHLIPIIMGIGLMFVGIVFSNTCKREIQNLRSEKQ